MFENFYKTFCDTIIAQFKIPRKGATMILLVLSTIVIIINKCIFHYSIAAKGSFLLQLIYGIWIFSCMSIPVKAYNEYCDKKDAEKAINIRDEEQKKKEEKEIEDAKAKINEYLEIMESCDYDEQEILTKFYYHQTTSVTIKYSQQTYVHCINHKGLKFISYSEDKAYLNTIGLKIINKYFDKVKPQFFEMMDSFSNEEVKLLKEFAEQDTEEIYLYKKEIKIAKKLIEKFENNDFYNISLFEDCLRISTLNLCYISRYFEEKEANFSLSK